VTAEFFLSEIVTVVPPPIVSAFSAYRAVSTDIEAALKADEAILLTNVASLKALSLDESARKDYVSAKAYRAQFQATEGHVAAKRAAAHIAQEEAKAQLIRTTDAVFKDLVRPPAPTPTPASDFDLLARVRAHEDAAVRGSGGAAPATPSSNAKQRKLAAKAAALVQAEAEKAAKLAAREAEAVEAKRAAATQAEADRATKVLRKEALRVKREEKKAAKKRDTRPLSTRSATGCSAPR